jgi:biopolymer transport protein ExbB/TolQ
MAVGLAEVTLSIIIGTLAAIVYSLRILVLLDRRIEKIEKHIEAMSNKIVQEEVRIEKAFIKKRK